MRAVTDANILVSAPLALAGVPAAIIGLWPDEKFTLPTCAEHLNEIRATLHKPGIAERIAPHKAGHRVNPIRKIAEGIAGFRA